MNWKTIVKWVSIALIVVGAACAAIVGVPEKSVLAVISAVFVLIGLILGLVGGRAVKEVKAAEKGAQPPQAA
jgi:predicted Na+-dependent transporter